MDSTLQNRLGCRAESCSGAHAGLALRLFTSVLGLQRLPHNTSGFISSPSSTTESDSALCVQHLSAVVALAVPAEIRHVLLMSHPRFGWVYIPGASNGFQHSRSPALRRGSRRFLVAGLHGAGSLRLRVQWLTCSGH